MKNTKARFISIVLIVMLGVGFLVGLNSTAPSMYKVAETYFEDSNLMDFRLLSTVGFTEEDINAVKEIEGVDDVMPSYFCDMLLLSDTGSVVRLYAVPESYEDNDIINELTLRDGRMPSSPDEILIGENRFGEDAIGSKISFASPSEDTKLSDTLSYSEFTIVGIVDSPLYISFERGSTNVGSGKISDYMFIPKEGFSAQRYTELYVTAESLGGCKPYSDEYVKLRDEFAKKLEDVGDLRVESFLSGIKASQSSLDEAKALFEEEKSKAEKELSDAQKKIDEARETLGSETAEAEEKLRDAKNEIDRGFSQLRDEKSEFEQIVFSAENDLDTAEKEITSGKEQLVNAKINLKETLFQRISALGITREQFDAQLGEDGMLSAAEVEKFASMAQMYKVMLGTRLASLETEIRAMESELEASGKDPDTDTDYLEVKKSYEELLVINTAIDEFLSGDKAELLGTVEEIEKNEAELLKAENEVKSARAALEKEKATAYIKFEDAKAQLETAREEYELGVKALEEKTLEAEGELNPAQTKLNESKNTAEKEFAKAEAELEDAQRELEDVPEPLWYYFNRDFNPGFAAYDDNVGRVTAVAKVFPVFFLLVAILVCVTTMSRLVEEQRADIGALTTLGYRKVHIIGKYLAYSVSASLIGAAIGIVLGTLTLPAVIFNAYRMLYSSLPKLIIKLDVTSAVVATLIAILCTSAVSYFTCNALLRKEPASLLRPKAPKAGKRILFERVKFLWKRLGFFSKVTVRNIVRYKVRFLMTVIGIAGCTALIVAAMGLHRSINDVVTLQFSEIFTNDAVVALENPEGDNSALEDKILSDERFSKTVLCRQNLAEIMTGWGRFTDDTYIVVPENTEAYTEIVNLRDRKSGEEVELTTSGVVLSEKLAKKLRVSVGDEITVVDRGIKSTLAVSGICENYLYGYVFMTAEVYRDNFGIDPLYNMYMCQNSQTETYNEDELSEEYLAQEGVLGVSFIDSSIASFEDMIESLNYVVIVMVICAAALAFVVLYNLTNINIAERKREISTLKVLGFKNTETSAYIYRENIVLTIVGTIVGLLLGVLLLKFVINTVEIDMVMFGRKMYAQTFIIAAVLTMVFSALVNVIMCFRIKKIDMIESLKSIE
ncbi:MAG: ABC transporter permease [Ruminococcus sp.]|nr:ABC transporter permease [Ruminococcus sp.]